MSLADDLHARSWDFDLLGTLRLLERSFPDRPRIGNSTTWEQDFVGLGEDPYLEFPACNINRTAKDESGRLRLFVRFLGLLGPQGPLPLQTTDEACIWNLSGHEGFSRFLDLLNHRFLQLFFRAWADARPIAQADRPDQDRFVAYIGSAVGLGTQTFLGLDSVSDTGRLAFAGLLGAKAKSGSRLRQAVEGMLGVRCEVEEFVGAFLPVEPADQTRLGGRHARLGLDCLVGSSVYSVEDKIRLRLFARDLSDYERFLPDGSMCTRMADLLFFYLGSELDCEVELALPKREVRPLCLSREAGGRLGYTSWMVKERDPEAEGTRCDARLNPAERANRPDPPQDDRPTHR